MVRNYVRTSNRSSYSKEQLMLAIQAVKAGDCSPFQAANDFNIPERTLRRYIAKDEIDFPSHGGRFRTVFSSQLEKELAQYVIEVNNRYFGMTPLQLRKFAYELADKNGLKHSFNNDTKSAGYDWLYSFMRRHPELRLRTPEGTSLSRVMGFNKPQVERFFALLTEVMTKHRFAASRIYNVDETGLPTVPTKLPKVIAVKGVKRVGKVTSGERGKTITCVCCMNASGGFIPPALLFPRKNMRADFIDQAPAETLGLATPSGWMTQEMFVKYLQHFVKFSHSSKEDQVLLILDNHESHVSLEAINFCRDNGIVMLTLPPHGTHKLQPLDVSFFGPMKTYYSRACDEWMVNHPGRAISEAQIGFLLKQCYEKAATIANATKGFAATGIYPMNMSVFNEADFAPALTSERNLVSSTVQDSPHPNQCLERQLHEELAPVQDQIVQALMPQPSQPEDEEMPIPEQFPIDPVLALPNVIAQTLDEIDHSLIALPVEEPQTSAALKATLGQHVLPHTLRPFSVAIREGNAKGRKRKSATVVTGSPHKTELEAIRSEKQAKEIKKQEREARKKQKEVKVKDNKTASIKKCLRNTVSSKKSKGVKERDASNECGYCGFLYGDPLDPLLDDDWVSCSRCAVWLHESCCDGRSPVLCEKCANDKR